MDKDLYDGHQYDGNNLTSCIRSKKTWIVFMRLIQSSIANSVVLFNAATNREKKKLALKVCSKYRKIII